MTTIDVNECPGSASREEKVPATEKSSEKSRAMADEKNATTPNESGEAVAVEFNLSDPEQLERQLARVDLTEEESDQLLREAYKVNKQLKMVSVYAECVYAKFPCKSAKKKKKKSSISFVTKAVCLNM